MQVSKAFKQIKAGLKDAINHAKLKRRHKIGSRVSYDGTGQKEYGIVVHTYIDEYDEQNCYVAFFGYDFPQGKLTTKESYPYILHYHAASLEKE